jgi:hypothetical protein
MRVFVVAIAISLAGCRGSFEFAQPREAPVVDVTPQVEALCSVRAARFHGLVTLPCIDVAREIRP